MRTVASPNPQFPSANQFWPNAAWSSKASARLVFGRHDGSDKDFHQKKGNPVRYCALSVFFVLLSPILIPIMKWVKHRVDTAQQKVSDIYGPDHTGRANLMYTVSEALGGLPWHKNLVTDNVFSNKPSTDSVWAYQSKAVNGICDVEESLSIPVPGYSVEVQAWFSPPKRGKPTVLFSLGVDGGVAAAAPLIRLLKKEGFGVFLYQYPFYGNPIASKKPHGKPSEELFLHTLDYLSDYLQEGEQPGHHKIHYRDQILMGYSLGGIVSAHVAAEHSTEKNKRDYRAIVIVGSPRSALDLFRDYAKEATQEALRIATVFIRFWSLFKRNGLKSVEMTLNDIFNNDGAIRQIRQPLLFIHGDQDLIARVKNTVEIAKFATNSTYVRMFTIEGADHYDIRNEENSEKAMEALKRFLNREDSHKPDERWSFTHR